MSNRRVVITGMGVISPIGIGVDNYWDAMLAKKSGIKTIDIFDTSDLKSTIAGMCLDFKAEDYFEKIESKRIDRFTQFGIVAAEMAYNDAGLENTNDETREDIGVIVGSGIGGISTFEMQHQNLLNGGPRRVGPFFIPMLITDIASGHIAIRLGLKGPNFSISSACASAAHSIGTSYLMIKNGLSDIIISGGTEAAITRMGLAGFCTMKALSTRNDEPQRASRPFDIDRDGFVIAEGAGVVILESEESAKKRGANIYAELAGIGISDDAHHIAAPCPEGSGAELSLKRALKSTNLNIEDIDYINSHGTSTPAGDIAEIRAINEVFGEYAKEIAINSTKSMIGHLLGAAGGVELIASVMSIINSKIPPTLNVDNQDPECNLDIVKDDVREKNINVAISNSFGFGGHNATLVIKKYAG